MQAANGPRIHQAIPDTTALLEARFASFGFGAAAANPSSGLVWCGEAVNTASHTGGRTALSVNTNDIAKTLDDGGWCDVEEDEEEGSSGAAKETMELTSVLKKRRKKMNRHKYVSLCTYRRACLVDLGKCRPPDTRLLSPTWVVAYVRFSRVLDVIRYKKWRKKMRK